MRNPNRTICGAKNRQGNPCQISPIAGKKRCKFHGGKTPKGTKGNRSNGLYSAYLTDDEAAQWESIPIGEVDAEIRMCRVWLNRCLALEATLKGANADGTELSEVRRSSSTDDGTTRMEAVSKRPDVMARANMLLGRISQLERTRAELIAAAQTNSDNPGDKARTVLDAMKAIMDTEGDL